MKKGDQVVLLVHIDSKSRKRLTGSILPGTRGIVTELLAFDAVVRVRFPSQNLDWTVGRDLLRVLTVLDLMSEV